jgi:hypothetical protein
MSSSILKDSRNVAAIDRLLKVVRRPFGILPFVGAGLSYDYAYPTWSGFLLESADIASRDKFDPRIATRVRAAIAKHRHEEAAQILISALHKEPFDALVSKTFDIGAIRWPTTPTAARLVPHLSAGPVLTTNFDPVMEAEHKNERETFYFVLWGARIHLAERILAENIHALFKLHGDAGDAGNRILATAEYDQHYGLPQPNDRLPLPRILLRMFRANTVLFLGCSLEGDRYMELLKRARRKQLPAKHYACVEDPGGSATAKRERFLRSFGITPIWFKKGKFSEIPALLLHLRNARERALGPHPVTHRYAAPTWLGRSTPGSHSTDLRTRERDALERTRILEVWSNIKGDRARLQFALSRGRLLYNAGFYADFVALANQVHSTATASKQSRLDHAELLYDRHLALRAIGGRRNIERANADLLAADEALAPYPDQPLRWKLAQDMVLVADKSSPSRAAALRRRARLIVMQAPAAPAAIVQLEYARSRLGFPALEISEQQREQYWKRVGTEEYARHILKRSNQALDEGNPVAGRAMAERAAKLILTKGGERRTLARALGNIASALHKQNRKPETLEYYLRALEWEYEANHPDGIAATLTNIAWLHYEVAQEAAGLGDEQAEVAKAVLRAWDEGLAQAIAVDEASGDNKSAIRDKIYRAPILVELGEPECALRDIRHALPKIPRNDHTTRAVALNNRGVAYEKLQRKALAARAYREAIKEADRGQEHPIRLTARGNLTNLEGNQPDTS